ncbi:MAG: hypothetical protein IKO41_00210 [Lachnospiraceae bacterium]|nr:hypothetical protein [Lachnospiraceae bacterium]
MASALIAFQRDASPKVYRTENAGQPEYCNFGWMLRNFQATPDFAKSSEKEREALFEQFLRDHGFSEIHRSLPDTKALFSYAIGENIENAMREKAAQKLGRTESARTLDYVYEVDLKQENLTISRCSTTSAKPVFSGKMADLESVFDLPTFSEKDLQAFTSKSKELTPEICQEVISYMPWKLAEIPAKLITKDLCAMVMNLVKSPSSVEAFTALEKAPDAVKNMDRFLKAGAGIVEKVYSSSVRRDTEREVLDRHTAVDLYDRKFSIYMNKIRQATRRRLEHLDSRRQKLMEEKAILARQTKSFLEKHFSTGAVKQTSLIENKLSALTRESDKLMHRLRDPDFLQRCAKTFRKKNAELTAIRDDVIECRRRENIEEYRNQELQKTRGVRR